MTCKLAHLSAMALKRLFRTISALAGDNDEWQMPSRAPGLHLLPSVRKPSRVLLSTKIGGLMAVNLLEDAPRDITVFARCWPLDECNLERIRAECCRGARSISFVGDLDPLALTVFLSLAAGLRLPGVRLRYAGIGERWLAICRRHIKRKWLTIFRRKRGLTDSHAPCALPTVPMTTFEIRMFRKLTETVSDLEEWIGATGMSLLESGHKLELEGASNPAFYDRGFPTALNRLLWKVTE